MSVRLTNTSDELRPVWGVTVCYMVGSSHEAVETTDDNEVDQSNWTKRSQKEKRAKYCGFENGADSNATFRKLNRSNLSAALKTTDSAFWCEYGNLIKSPEMLWAEESTTSIMNENKKEPRKRCLDIFHHWSRTRRWLLSVHVRIWKWKTIERVE